MSELKRPHGSRFRDALVIVNPGACNPSGIALSIADAHHGLSPQILVEPIERVLPSLFRGGFVITRCRVVVKAMVGSLVDMTFVGNLGFGERGVERGPSGR